MDGNLSGSQRFDLTFDDVCDCIFEIFDENKRFCRYPIDYRLLADTDMGHVKSYVEHPVGSVGYRFSRMRERVGVKSLLEHMLSDGRVRNDDAVMAIFQAFHENAHVWQHSVGYVQPPERSTFEMDHMARMHVIWPGCMLSARMCRNTEKWHIRSILPRSWQISTRVLKYGAL